jgi:drug/metabolite transporter (DMT)-like permease
LISSEFTSILLGLASAATWGVGDFSAGLASRRTSVIIVTLLSQVAGLALLILLALVWAESPPSVSDVGWSSAAGVVGMVGLLALYQAIATGQMGIAAPVTGVLSAALPVAVSLFTQGAPGSVRLMGFVLALAGIWFISRPQGGIGRPTGLGLALLAGVCLGSFLVLIAQVEHQAVFWPLVVARSTSSILILVLVLARRGLARPASSGLGLILFAGLMDAGGNALFVLAEQAGRLDVAGTLSSLYPATTVLLALFILKERLNWGQGLGVLLALIAVPLIAG